MLFKKNTQKIIILGINNFTLYFANRFCKKNDLVMLEKGELKEEYEIDAIFAKINRDLFSTLMDFKIESADLFLAMTENEEYNLFATRLAAECGAKKTIAMVKNPAYINLTSASYIFNPYQLIINKTDKIINETRLGKSKEFIPGKINLIEHKITTNDSYAYNKIKNIRIDNGLIFAIKRKDKYFISYEDLEIFPGDIIYIMFLKGIYSKKNKQIVKQYKQRKKVFIIGGNNLGYYQAMYWKDIYDTIVIIEPDLRECHKFAEKTDDFLILHGEGIERKILMEEGLDKDSIILAYDKNDFHNLLSSYLVKKIGCKDVITLLNFASYTEIANFLNLDKIILLPELITAHLEDYIYSSTLENKKILGDEIYTKKIKISKDSKVINKKIKEIDNKSFIIGVIFRNNNIIIPGKEDFISQDDELQIFFYRNREYRVYNIFK